MKTKLELNDWFYNAGLIGFLRIMEKYKKDAIVIQDNYIEFDTNSLKEFHQYYFQYLFEIYDIAKTMEKRMDESFNRMKQYLEIQSEDKKELNEAKERLKKEKKYIKDSIKKQMDKIKKFDQKTENEISEEYNKIDAIKEKEQIEELESIFNKIEQCLYKDHINKKLTTNLFKSILSNKYFGQPSFLNVVKNSASYEEQVNLMYRDYISNIIETGYLKDFIDDKYTLENLKEHIENLNQELITKEMLKIYTDIKKKYIEKGKQINEIKEYIEKDVFKICYLCADEHCITSNYSESNFLPIAVSSDNMKNFFWNQKISYQICDICKLIMFCIPMGLTTITKITRDNQKYEEKDILSFVNYDTSIENLLKTNNNFASKSKRDRYMDSPYADLLIDIVEQEKDISKWQLENIFVVEIDAEYLAYSRIEYFRITRPVAIFFKEYADKSLMKIKDYRFKTQMVDKIMKNKDTKYIINDKIRDVIKNKYGGYETFLASKTRMEIKSIQKGERNMSEIEKKNKKLIALYSIGTEIHEELKKKGTENKLDGYVYKMLNCVKTGNKKEFMDNVIRLHMALGKDVSPIFLDVMKEEQFDFATIGHSFLSGLASNKFESKTTNTNESIDE